MAATLVYHITPSFTQLAIPDNSPVEDVIRYICQLRSKEQSIQPLFISIVQQTHATTVGDLRKLTDTEWHSLHNVPVMMRILLKNLVRQSVRGTLTKTSQGDPFLVALQDDFNYGQPFDMSLYSHNLSMLGSMGFKRDEAMEALCVTENKSVESALEYLFLSDPTQRRRLRSEVVERLGRTASKVKNQQEAQAAAKELAEKAHSNNASNHLSTNELSLLRQQLQAERNARLKVESEIKSHLDVLPRLVYKEFIKGLIADETISIVEYEQLKLYRDKKKISMSDHLLVLSELGLTNEKFESMKKFEVGAKRENECVVCLDKPKSHVILPCMHLCLCDDCAVSWVKKNAKCPICSKKLTQILRIFT